MSRRATPSKPTALRRIVKTVTHEIIEEIIPAHPSTQTVQKRIAATKTTVPAIVKRDPFTTPKTVPNTTRVVPALKKTILKRTTVKRTPLNSAVVIGPPVRSRKPFTTAPLIGISAKETPVKKTPINQTPLIQAPTIQSPEKKSHAVKPLHPRNHPRNVPTKKHTKTIGRANSTPKTPKALYTPISRKQFPSRTSFTYKSSKHQPAQPKSRLANRTLQSAIAKRQPATNAKRGKTYKLPSRTNEYSLSPSANLAPVLAPALYNSQFPTLGSYHDSPSRAHPYSAAPNCRSGYSNARSGKQTVRVPPDATLSSTTAKMEPTAAIKQENIVIPPSRTRSVHDRMGKVNQTSRNSSTTSHRKVSVKPEPEEKVKCEPSIEPSLQTSTVHKVKWTARKSLGANSPPSSYTTLTTRPDKRTGSAFASSTRTKGIWVVTHETGYYSDRFRSYRAPFAHEVGTFVTRTAAINKGKDIVGDVVGYSWQEVCEAGGLQVVSDTEQKWEITWSRSNSQYSKVTACLIPEGGGVWAVDLETGFMPDRFHSKAEPTTKRLGLYVTRQLAVDEGKKRLGHASGWDWKKVSQNRYFEIRKDCAERWEGFWGPPGSEYTLIVVKRIGMPMGGVSEMR